MKQLSTIMFNLWLLLFAGSISFAQPEISKDKIPVNTPADVKDLILNLYSTNAMDRAKAAAKLKKEKLAIPFLVAMLGDDAALVWSAYGPGSGGASTSPGFEAAKSLRWIGGDAVPALMEALRDKDAIARQNAAIAILWIGERHGKKSISPATDILIKTLKDESFQVRWRAAWALKVLGWRPTDQKSLVDFLILTQDFEELSEIGQPAVPALIAALKSKGWDTRRGASKTLGSIGDVRAVGPLIEILNDEILEVRKSVAEALTKLTGQAFGQEYENWRNWWDKNKTQLLKPDKAALTQ